MYYSADIFFRNAHHLSDARFAAGIWAKWISFNFDKTSPHYVSPTVVAEILPWLSGPEIVAEFGEENTKLNILETARILQIKSLLLPLSKVDTILPADFTIYTKEQFNKVSDQGKVELIPIDINQSSEYEVLLVQGVFEDKPGDANYEAISKSLEPFEL